MFAVNVHTHTGLRAMGVAGKVQLDAPIPDTFAKTHTFCGGSRGDLRRNTAGERAFLRATELNTAAGNN